MTSDTNREKLQHSDSEQVQRDHNDELGDLIEQYPIIPRGLRRTRRADAGVIVPHITIDPPLSETEAKWSVDTPCPPGYVLVPIEPTEEMISRGLAVTNSFLNIKGSQLTVNREKMRLRYKAMIGVP